MEWHCAGCSIARFTHRHCRNISVRIMIRCIGSISGRPICVVLEVQEIRTVPYVPLSHRGETDRNDPPGILGPNALLDNSRFRGEAPTLPGLFQSTTCAFGLARTAARTW